MANSKDDALILFKYYITKKANSSYCVL